MSFWMAGDCLRAEYLHNILQRQLGVRSDLAEECLGILQDNGEFAGIISEVDGEYLVRLPEPDIAGSACCRSRQGCYRATNAVSDWPTA